MSKKPINIKKFFNDEAEGSGSDDETEESSSSYESSFIDDDDDDDGLLLFYNTIQNIYSYIFIINYLIIRQ